MFPVMVKNCVENIFSAIYSRDAKLDPYRCPSGLCYRGNKIRRITVSCPKFDGKCYMDSDAEFTNKWKTLSMAMRQ